MLIAAERQAQAISELLIHLHETLGATDVVTSSVSVLELEHGLWRATTDEIRAARRAYLDGIYASIPIQPFTKEIAQLAARIDAQSRKEGVVIPVIDLQIGVTALYLDYALATRNARHFRMIPGLEVIEV